MQRVGWCGLEDRLCVLENMLCRLWRLKLVWLSGLKILGLQWGSIVVEGIKKDVSVGRTGRWGSDGDIWGGIRTCKRNR